MRGGGTMGDQPELCSVCEVGHATMCMLVKGGEEEKDAAAISLAAGPCGQGRCWGHGKLHEFGSFMPAGGRQASHPSSCDEQEYLTEFFCRKCDRKMCQECDVGETLDWLQNPPPTCDCSVSELLTRVALGPLSALLVAVIHMIPEKTVHQRIALKQPTPAVPSTQSATIGDSHAQVSDNAVGLELGSDSAYGRNVQVKALGAFQGDLESTIHKQQVKTCQRDLICCFLK